MDIFSRGKDLSGCEKLIMKIVWDSKTDISAIEISEALRTRYGKNYARTTVATFIQRLIDKGFVSTYRKGKNAYIHSLKDEQEYMDAMMNSMVDFWFQGDAAYLMSSLCSEHKPSQEEIGNMRKLLDELGD